jgi:polyisoprenoid-binding protein YceI
VAINKKAMTNKSVIMLLLILAQFAAKAQQTYQLDIKKSKILWDNRKTMGGHHGYILFDSGTFSFTPRNIIGNGSFIINMNSMSATDGDDAHNAVVKKKLRADNYFAMDKYPTATMHVMQVTQIGYVSTTYKTSGDLTIKGTTNPVTFTATIVKKGNTLTATATTTIDRLLWHIDMQAPNQPWNVFGAIQNKVTPDEILIKLDLVFVKGE